MRNSAILYALNPHSRFENSKNSTASLASTCSEPPNRREVQYVQYAIRGFSPRTSKPIVLHQEKKHPIKQSVHIFVLQIWIARQRWFCVTVIDNIKILRILRHTSGVMLLLWLGIVWWMIPRISVRSSFSISGRGNPLLAACGFVCRIVQVGCKSTLPHHDMQTDGLARLPVQRKLVGQWNGVVTTYWTGWCD